MFLGFFFLKGRPKLLIWKQRLDQWVQSRLNPASFTSVKFWSRTCCRKKIPFKSSVIFFFFFLNLLGTLLLFDFPEQEALWSLCPPACLSSRVPQVFRAFGNRVVWGSADVLRSGESSCWQNAAVRPADCPLYPYVSRPAGDFSSTCLSAAHPLQLSCACAYWWWWYQSEKEFKLHKKQKQFWQYQFDNWQLFMLYPVFVQQRFW